MSKIVGPYSLPNSAIIGEIERDEIMDYEFDSNLDISETLEQSTEQESVMDIIYN